MLWRVFAISGHKIHVFGIIAVTQLKVSHMTLFAISGHVSSRWVICSDGYSQLAVIKYMSLVSLLWLSSRWVICYYSQLAVIKYTSLVSLLCFSSKLVKCNYSQLAVIKAWLWSWTAEQAEQKNQQTGQNAVFHSSWLIDRIPIQSLPSLLRRVQYIWLYFRAISYKMSHHERTHHKMAHHTMSHH
jgi:hypothetical protein